MAFAIDTLLAQTGQAVFMVTILGATGLAFSETLSALRLNPATDLEAKNRSSTFYRAEIKRILPASIALALLQVIGILSAYWNPDFRALAPIAITYLFIAIMLPFLWAAGSYHAAACSLPRAPAWATSRKQLIITLLATVGILVSFALVILINIKPGEAVQDLSSQVENPMVMVVMALWLLFNAPWVEELVFRHYLIPRLAACTRWKATFKVLAISLVLCAAIFAVGHAGHMIPAWPKLTQTFVWGLLLGLSRIYFGTLSAVLLHLIFNLSAPLAAPFLQT